MKKRAAILSTAVILILAAATAVCIAVRGGSAAFLTQLLTADGLLLGLAVIVLLCLVLRESASETLYSYLNISLVGGIIFVSVTELMLLGYLVSCISDPTLLSPDGMITRALGWPRRFSYYAVLLIAAIGIAVAVSNIALIRHEGFRPSNLLGVLLAVFYIAVTLALYALADRLETYFSGNRTGIIVNTAVSTFMMVMLCYFECAFIGVCIFGYKAARHEPEYDKDFIIILGCAISKEAGLLPLLKGRVNRSVRFVWDQERATGRICRYIPSGGQGPDEVMSEGSAMELYLLSHGAEADEVFPEKKSRDTRENLMFSKQIADSLVPGAKLAFATTNYHILRSGMLARDLGFDAEGVAGDTKWYFWPNGFIREFFAILNMRRRAHLSVAAVTFAICAVLGAALYFSNLI